MLPPLIPLAIAPQRISAAKDDFALQMALQTVQRSAWLYGRRELVGGGFHGDGGPGFLSAPARC